jgi:hypothetical protein
MSAIEWLHFINPFIVITLVIALVACVPVTRAWRKQFQLSDKPLAFKKVLFAAFSFIALGWVLAWIAPHILTPLVRVNMMATSQLILTVALVFAGLITLVRIFQRNNLFSLLLISAKRHALIIITVVGTMASGVLVLFADSADENENKNKKQEKSAYDVPRSHMNKRGEYCGKGKSNWY